MKLLPELQFKQKPEENEGVEFFKDYRGIKTLVFELLKDARKGDIYRYFAPETKYYKISTDRVYSAEKQLRKDKGLKTRAIFPESSRISAKKSKTSIKKFINSPLPPNTLILNNKVAIITWAGVPSGILIHSKDIYESYVSFFEHVWGTAKE
jgi:hypothetical protein